MEGLRLNFFKIFACFWPCVPRTCRELAENLPRSCAACGRLPSIAKLLWPRTVGPRSSEGGWGGGGPPRGVSIRRPPKVCQRRARLISNWLCPITAGQSRHSFEQFVRAIRSEVFFPLSFPFPRSLGITGAQLQKIAFCVLLAHLGRFFRLSNCACKMTSKKHRKKCENQGFWDGFGRPKNAKIKDFG